MAMSNKCCQKMEVNEGIIYYTLKKNESFGHIWKSKVDIRRQVRHNDSTDLYAKIFNMLKISK